MDEGSCYSDFESDSRSPPRSNAPDNDATLVSGGKGTKLKQSIQKKSKGKGKATRKRKDRKDNKRKGKAKGRRHLRFSPRVTLFKIRHFIISFCSFFLLSNPGKMAQRRRVTGGVQTVYPQPPNNQPKSVLLRTTKSLFLTPSIVYITLSGSTG